MNTEAPQMAPTVVYDPGVGTHIDSACKEAATMAARRGCEVRFKFNDVTLVAKPGESWSAISRRYDAECNRRRKEYYASPQGKADIAARQRRIKERRPRKADRNG